MSEAKKGSAGKAKKGSASATRATAASAASPARKRTTAKKGGVVAKAVAKKKSKAKLDEEVLNEIERDLEVTTELPGETKARKTAAKKTTAKTGTKKGTAKKGASAESAPPDRTTVRRESAMRTALDIAEAALEKKAERIEIVDIGEKVDYADYLVVMTGRSDRQVVSIARGIEESLERKRGQRTVGMEGLPQGQWVLIDYGDVIVHVFLDEARKYYDLEGLWMDAPRVPTPSFLPTAPVTPGGYVYEGADEEER